MPRIHYHEVEVSNYPLFQYPPYCLALASRMAEVAETYELDLLHVHYAIPHSISALLAQQMLAARAPAAVRHHAARHRHHAGGHGPLLLPDHEVLHRAVRRRHVASASTCGARRVDVFGVRNEIRVITNFVNCELYRPDRQKARAKRYAPKGEKLLIHLSNFRPVKRVAGLHPHPGGGA